MKPTRHTLRELPLVIAIAALGFLTPAHANDSSYFASGNQIIPLQETDISVKKEILTIKRIKDNKVSITVDYTFHNPGKEKTILMGFEATSPFGDVNESPRDGEHRYIENFTVKINDQPVPHKVSLLTPTYRENEANKALYTLEDLKQNLLTQNPPKTANRGRYYVYHFNATFPSGETRVIHTYDYAISGSVLTHIDINYLLTPALRWANKQIDDFTLMIDLGEFQQYHINPTFFENTNQWTTQGRVKILMQDLNSFLTQREIDGLNHYLQYQLNHYSQKSQVMTVWQQKGSITFHAKNFKPKGELSLFSYSINYEINEDIIDSKTLKTSLREKPHFFLEEAKLKNEFTRKVLENIPYAQRGYAFKNKELRAYFEGQPWYMPDPYYKEADFTEEEKAWLKKVRALKVVN